MSWEMASVRVIFIVSVITAAYHLRPFHWSSWVSSLVGAALACAFLFIEMRLRKASLKRLIGAVVGGIFGVTGALIISHLLSLTSLEKASISYVQITLLLLMGYVGLVHLSAIGADLHGEADYARSKGAGEAAVKTAFASATILRPSIVFGPEDDFFNRFAVMARLSPVLPLIGGGQTRFQPVYVGDVADAIAKAVVDPACRGKTYELGGPRVYTFKELMELLLHEIRRHRVLLPLPFSLANLQAAMLELLPFPPLTRDQVKLLRRDNVVSPTALTLADLGIKPTAAEVILPTYLDRYRPGGRFSGVAVA